FATGFIIATALYFIGHKYWLLWGIIATTLNFIPNIGSILAAIPALIVSMATMGLVPTLGTLAVYVSVNVAIGSYLEPKIIGDKLGLSTLIVFLSMIAFGKIFGMVGMFLSVPIIVAIKIALDVIKPDNKISLLLK
ncbi:AI-2E family transporter, partial [Vibrio parahaemolyticus]|nr:AI-2E family transporter [Vibrio parahaemolyticus]